MFHQVKTSERFEKEITETRICIQSDTEKTEGLLPSRVLAVVDVVKIDFYFTEAR